MRQKSKIAPIGDVVKSVFKELDKRQALSKEDIEGTWRGIVGETGFGHSRPVRLHKKVLSVRVDNSIWLQNLVMKKRSILKELKRAYGKDKIFEIQFKIGEF